VKRLPRHACVAEVGSARGRFARHILATSEPAELHLIDLDFSLLHPELRKDPRVVLHEGSSDRVLAGFPDAFFDWIYIDADHSYAAVLQDATVASAKVKPGGYLVFNDFAHIDLRLGTYGVHRAVTQFAIARGWSLAWFAYSPHALYDVALRRPVEERE
jgi:hypothetical protein